MSPPIDISEKEVRKAREFFFLTNDNDEKKRGLKPSVAISFAEVVIAVLLRGAQGFEELLFLNALKEMKDHLDILKTQRAQYER